MSLSDVDVAPPAPVPDRPSPELIDRLRCAVETIANSGVSEASIQDLLTATIALYFVEFDQGNKWMPVRGDSELSATAILTLVCMLMHSANVDLFELGLWQNWAGIKN